MKEYLATYRHENKHCYAWFESEDQAQQWLDNYSDNYKYVSVIELVVTNMVKGVNNV